MEVDSVGMYQCGEKIVGNYIVKLQTKKSTAQVFRKFNSHLLYHDSDNVALQSGNVVITAEQHRIQDDDFTSGRIWQLGVGFTYRTFVNFCLVATTYGQQFA